MLKGDALDGFTYLYQFSLHTSSPKRFRVSESCPVVWHTSSFYMCQTVRNRIVGQTDKITLSKRGKFFPVTPKQNITSLNGEREREREEGSESAARLIYNFLYKNMILQNLNKIT